MVFLYAFFNILRFSFVSSIVFVLLSLSQKSLIPRRSPSNTPPSGSTADPAGSNGKHVRPPGKHPAKQPESKLFQTPRPLVSEVHCGVKPQKVSPARYQIHLI
jgi:hypothetical protein